MVKGLRFAVAVLLWGFTATAAGRINTGAPPQADLIVTKTNGVTTVVPGGTVTYTIVASNAGPDPDPAVMVADTFPPTLSCVWTCLGAGGSTCTAGPVAGDINDIANLPSGGAASYTAVCTVDPADTGSLVNFASVTNSSGILDPNLANNVVSDQDFLTPFADLVLAKTDGLTTAAPGDPITYTLAASNAGPSNAPAVVTDTFPASLGGVSWACVGSGGGVCTANGAGDLNDAVTLPSGAAVTYTISATISGAFLGTLSNSATVAIPPLPAGGATDPETANNSATDTTLVRSPADVTATKSVAGDFQPGGAITYTIVLTNNGAGTQLDNPGDEFADVVPPELTVTGTGASSGTAGAVGNTVSWNGAIPGGGGTVTITIDATVNDGAQGVISNQGTVNFDADGNGTNESSGVTDDPVPDGTTDPTDFEIVLGAPAIPTLSTWGLMLMALALLGAAVFLVRRRRVGA